MEKERHGDMDVERQVDRQKRMNVQNKQAMKQAAGDD
jgi:hypothetical protein